MLLTYRCFSALSRRSLRLCGHSSSACYDPRLKIVVGISGASGVVYGMRLLERLRAQPEVEIHLILTRSGEKTLHIETGQTAAHARKLAHFSYSLEDIGSPPAGGSFLTQALGSAPGSTPSTA